MAKRKNCKRKINDLQNITYNTKDRLARTSLKTEGELICSVRVSSSLPTSGIRPHKRYT